MKDNHRQLIWSYQFKFVQILQPLVLLSGYWLFPAIGEGTSLQWLFELLGTLCFLVSALMAGLAYINLSRRPEKGVSRWMVCAKD